MQTAFGYSVRILAASSTLEHGEVPGMVCPARHTVLLVRTEPSVLDRVVVVVV